MAAFDFITNEDLRASLEADQAEMLACEASKAWKAVHVLAGSIIEAVLLDFLVVSKYQNLPPEDILKMDLHRAIEACQAEGVLSNKAAQLSAVIKDYRNLIHPGRSIRLSEGVDENSAHIAKSLLAMILAEIAKKKAEKWGNTAEQIVSKLLADPSAIGILSHLLHGMNELEIERLLLKAIPDQYLPLLERDPLPDVTMTSLRQCFHHTLKKAAIETKKKVTDRHVKIIKEDGESKVIPYVDAFVRLSEPYPTKQEQEHKIIKDHLLTRLGRRVTGSLLEALEGIGQFVTPEELPLFLWPLFSEYAVGADGQLGLRIKDLISKERLKMNSRILMEARKVLDGFIVRYQNEKYGHGVLDKARAFRAVLDAPRPN